MILLKEEKEKLESDSKLIEEYQTHQLGDKLFANAGFEFSNYQVAECITAEGRLIHKQMESVAQNEPFNFNVVFGFTDSAFFKDAGVDSMSIRKGSSIFTKRNYTKYIANLSLLDLTLTQELTL